ETKYVPPTANVCDSPNPDVTAPTSTRPLPSLQFTVAVCESKAPGALNVTVIGTTAPVVAVWSAPPFADGATFVTVTFTVSVSHCASLSQTSRVATNAASSDAVYEAPAVFAWVSVTPAGAVQW